jgi:hypothetical protein
MSKKDTAASDGKKGAPPINVEDPYKFHKQRRVASEFTRKNHIQELLAHLLQLVVYHKPEDPRAFMIAEVKKLQQQKPTALFDDEDLSTMFEMVDVSRQRTISKQQLESACKNLDVQNPPPVEGESVDPEQFQRVMSTALRTPALWQ